MSSDFFQRQDDAKRKTKLLIFYYILSVACIICAVYAAVHFSLALFFDPQRTLVQFEDPNVALSWFNSSLFIKVALSVVLIVLLGTLYKTVQMSKGGKAIATLLGGRRVDPHTLDKYERRLLNIVEEIAIASGVPVPAVYALDEEIGINAFAAGRSFHDAVIGVTRGTMRTLSRDELQGVIAHEYSHILNGDMKMNIRLISVLHGILLIALIGQLMIRGLGRSRFHSSSDSKSNGAGILFLFGFGFLLYAIGYIGVFFGNVIKGAISRQREYLADASAVQFTRNPEGLAGALKKIGGFHVGKYPGSFLRTPHAQEASHMYFAKGLGSMLDSLFSTHPPLIKRIQLLDSSFDGWFEPFEGLTVQDLQVDPPHASLSSFTERKPVENALRFAESVQKTIGVPTNVHHSYSKRILQTIPERLREILYDQAGAQALLASLVLHKDKLSREEQKKIITTKLGENVWEKVEPIERFLLNLGVHYRLPLVDLAMPELRTLPSYEKLVLYQTLEALCKVDDTITLFEYVLTVVARHTLQLNDNIELDSNKISLHSTPALDALRLTLSHIARVGALSERDAEHAFQQGAKSVDLNLQEIIKSSECHLQDLNTALYCLAKTSFIDKQVIIIGCVACITADGFIAAQESELLRAICDILGCPLPPLFVDD